MDGSHRVETAVQHGAMEYSVPPTDLDEVRRYRLGRACDEGCAIDPAPDGAEPR